MAMGYRPGYLVPKSQKIQLSERKQKICRHVLCRKRKKNNAPDLSSLVLEKVPTGIRGLDQVLHGGGDQIIAVPTLVRRLPTPVKKIIGDLSNTERVLVGLDLRPAGGWR